MTDRLDFQNLHRDFAPRGDCCVAAAGIGAAGSLGGSIFGGIMGSNAITDAAASGNEAMMKKFKMVRNLLAPFIHAGTQEMKGKLMPWLNYANPNSPLNALMKLTMPGADMTKTLEQTPGYQFTRDMGMKSIDNSLAARGLAGPGGALGRSLADYVTGLSSNTWSNVVGNLTNTFNSGAGAMQNFVNTGAGAASALAGNATSTGQQMSQNLMSAGQGQAAGYNAIGGGIGNAGNYFSNAMMMNKLLGLYGGGGATA